MARGTTFGQMIEMTKLEAGLDPDPALSMSSLPLIKQLIKREYERLYDEFDWPFTRVREDVMTVAGQRYYDIPSTLDLERIEGIQYYWGLRWHDLERGIQMSDYTAYNSDNDARHEPAWKWDIHYTGPTAQIELWPMPSTNDKKVRFHGIRRPTALVQVSDGCDLDDQMIVLFAASEYLARRSSPEAPLKQQKAVQRFHLMKGKSITSKNNSFSFTKQPEPKKPYRGPLVAYVRN
jgi:hypothetical protein